MIREISLLPSLVAILYAASLVFLGNLLLYGFQHFDVNIGTVILSMELVFAIILGFLFFQEVLVRNEIIGGLFIFVASILIGVDWNGVLKRIKRG